MPKHPVTATLCTTTTSSSSSALLNLPVIQEIHANSDIYFSTQRKTGETIQYYHSLTLLVSSSSDTRSSSISSRKIYVGDVVCIDCPEDDDTIEIPPCPGRDGYHPFQPDRPWKVGLILSLWATVKQTGEEETYDMAVQWLHRDIHIPPNMPYKSDFSKRFRIEKRYSMLIESNHFQERISVARIIPVVAVQLVDTPEEREDIVLQDLTNHQGGMVILQFAVPHRFKDTTLSATEKTIGWHTINSCEQSNSVPLVLQRAWDAKDVWMRSSDILREGQIDQMQQFLDASKRIFEQDAPQKLAYRRQLQEKQDQILKAQERQNQVRQEEFEKKTTSVTTNSKKTTTKKATTVKKKTVTKTTAPKKKATANKTTTTKISKEKITNIATKAKNKAAKPKVSTGKKRSLSTTSTNNTSKTATERTSFIPKSKKARSTQAQHEQEEEFKDDVAVPVGKPIHVNNVNKIRYFTSIQLPWDTLRWDAAVRQQKEQQLSGSSTSEPSWTFHVGDVIAVASSNRAPPPHDKTTLRKKTRTQKNEWFPFNLMWCPAIVLAIYEDAQKMTVMQAEDSADSSKYRMDIQWLIRWGDLHKNVQQRLLKADQENGTTIATELQAIPHMVIESDVVNRFSVTAALGKLKIVSSAASSVDSGATTAIATIPPSLTLQCRYATHLDESEKYSNKTFLGEGSISNFFYDAQGYDTYYERLNKGGFQPWLRLAKVEKDLADVVEKYRAFLGKGKTIVGWTNNGESATATKKKGPAKTQLPPVKPTRSNPKRIGVSSTNENTCRNALPKFMADFQDEYRSSTPLERRTPESPAAISTESTIPNEDRILVPSKPIHKDESSGRAYYDHIQIVQPFSDYAILTNSPNTDHDRWDLRVGEVVVISYINNEKAGGSAFFEPNTLKQPIASREMSKHYPFLGSWGVAEVVSIWHLEQSDKSRKQTRRGAAVDGMMVECRWFYRKKEVPGFANEGGKAFDGSVDEYEEVFESDHIEDLPATSLLAPAILHSCAARTDTCHFDKGMPVLRFHCRRFWSVVRRSLVPCGGLDLRVTRGRSRSRYVREDAVLRELMCPSCGPKQAAEAIMTSVKQGRWKEAFQNVIQKLSLTDASKESSESFMIGRDKEQKEIRSFLKEAICGGSDETGSSMFVAGPPGVGKTACIRAAIAKLQRDQAQGLVPAFRFVSLNGMEMRHPFEAYVRLLEALQGGLKIRKSEEEAADALQKYFTVPSKSVKKDEDIVTVVLLDEIDYLVTQKQTVMYNFFDWPRRSVAMFSATGQTKRLVVIGVSNTLNLPERLQPRVQSRIGNRRCYFKSYNVKEIQSILESKITQASPVRSILWFVGLLAPVLQPLLFASIFSQHVCLRCTTTACSRIRQGCHFICRSKDGCCFWRCPKSLFHLSFGRGNGSGEPQYNNSNNNFHCYCYCD